MIEELSLKNFKGIREGRLKLSPLTILLGGNNSGKTTILEALFLAPNPFRSVPYSIGNHRVAVEVVNSLHQTLNSEGYGFLLNKYTAENAEIRCRVKDDEILLQFLRIGDQIEVSTNKAEVSHHIINFRGKEIRSFGSLSVSSFAIPSIKHSGLFLPNSLLISSRLINPAYDYIEQNWASIINLGIGVKVAEEASQLSREKYKDITIEPFLGRTLAVYAYREDGTRIRLGDLGEGMQSYIISRMLYEVEKPNILLWDDVEAHFNPRILLRIAEWFYDITAANKQVVLTTHSLEAARTIAGFSEEIARIYLLSLEDGVLKTREMKLEDVEELLKAGVDVRVAEPLLL